VVVVVVIIMVVIVMVVAAHRRGASRIRLVATMEQIDATNQGLRSAINDVAPQPAVISAWAEG
jgi:hypothetical protein